MGTLSTFRELITQAEHAAAGFREDSAMRSIVLWMVGVPIPIILLLAMCTHHL